MFLTFMHFSQNIAVCQACCLFFITPLPHSSATIYSISGAPGGWAAKGAAERNVVAQISILQVQLKKCPHAVVSTSALA